MGFRSFSYSSSHSMWQKIFSGLILFVWSENYRTSLRMSVTNGVNENRKTSTNSPNLTSFTNRLPKGDTRRIMQIFDPWKRTNHRVYLHPTIDAHR